MYVPVRQKPVRNILTAIHRRMGTTRIVLLVIVAIAIGGGATFLPLAFFALVLTWLYERTGNLLAPILGVARDTITMHQNATVAQAIAAVTA